MKIDMSLVPDGTTTPDTPDIPDGIIEPTANVPSANIYFDLQGRRLTTLPAKGLYLWNGQKYVKY